MGFLMLLGWFESGTDPHYLVSVLFFGVTVAGILSVGIGESLNRSKSGYLTIFIFATTGTLAYSASLNYPAIAVPEIIGASGVVAFSSLWASKILLLN